MHTKQHRTESYLQEAQVKEPGANKGIHTRYICLHPHHERPYKSSCSARAIGPVSLFVTRCYTIINIPQQVGKGSHLLHLLYTSLHPHATSLLQPCYDNYGTYMIWHTGGFAPFNPRHRGHSPHLFTTQLNLPSQGVFLPLYMGLVRTWPFC